MATDAHEVAKLVPMTRLLEALGIAVNERTRRAPCILHGGSNPTAFAWRDDGRWRCFSCGASGDRIALVRAVRQCSFRGAVEFFAVLAGVRYRPRSVPQREIQRARMRRERAQRAAWRIRDEMLCLRRYYADGLRRAERLWDRIGRNVLLACDDEHEAVWAKLARLAPAATYLLAAREFLNRADAALLARFVLASPVERHALILGEPDADAAKVT